MNKETLYIIVTLLVVFTGVGVGMFVVWDEPETTCRSPSFSEIVRKVGVLRNETAFQGSFGWLTRDDCPQIIYELGVTAKTSADEIISPVSMECKQAVLESRASSDMVTLVSRTDMKDLSDRSRWLWQQALGITNKALLEPCKALWAETITAMNDYKRNEDFFAQCIGNLSKRNPPAVDLMSVPYLQLNSSEKLILREAISGYNRSTHAEFPLPLYNCHRYYPHIWYNEWRPLYEANGYEPLSIMDGV